MTTVLIVDDHGEFRASARELLEEDGFAVIGEAADGAEALLEVERLRPEIVLLDVALPDFDGFAIAELLSTRPNPPTVILVSSRDASAYAGRIAASAARGFIAKSRLAGAAVRAMAE